MSLMVKQPDKKISIRRRVELIKVIEKIISDNFKELHRLYYDDLSEEASRRLITEVLKDGDEHYVIPK